MPCEHGDWRSVVWLAWRHQVGYAWARALVHPSASDSSCCQRAAVTVVAADLHQSSRRLGCCSCHAWQAEDWVVDRCRSVRYRYYR